MPGNFDGAALLPVAMMKDGAARIERSPTCSS
jgi:hypothetical protein